MHYYMEDFTETNYKTILEKLVLSGYKFSEFDYEAINLSEKFVLWRRDVDYFLNP